MLHHPVLPDETLANLSVRPAGLYIDGTLGGAGHAERILQAGGSSLRLLGLDRDPDAVERARTRLAGYGSQFEAVQANLADLGTVAAERGFAPVDGVLFDLGVSSFQLDDPARGFSFQQDGPLDMRMDPTRGETVAELLKRLRGDWRELAQILREYGEEPQAARIAKEVVAALDRTPIETTGALAEVVERAVGGRRGASRHPATRTFQALRIAVNDELTAIEAGLEAALNLLRPGGRLVVLAFHSLEDRLVKTVLKDHAGRWEALQQGGRRWIGREPALRLPTRRAIRPGTAEVASNPRARSVRLRVAERLDKPPCAVPEADGTPGAWQTGKESARANT